MTLVRITLASPPRKLCCACVDSRSRLKHTLLAFFGKKVVQKEVSAHRNEQRNGAATSLVLYTRLTLPPKQKSPPSFPFLPTLVLTGRVTRASLPLSSLAFPFSPPPIVSVRRSQASLQPSAEKKQEPVRLPEPLFPFVFFVALTRLLVGQDIYID